MIEEMLIDERDLIENPTTRLPVCLCLDSSGSMQGKPIHELNRGVKYFFEAIKNDEVARYSVELSIVSFNSRVETIANFASVDYQSVTMLNASGVTSMGAGVERALALLEERKNKYSRKGVDYYQPWLVLMSDGEPTDAIDDVVSKVNALSRNKKLTVFSVAIGDDANISELKKFSSLKDNLVLKVKSPEDFQEFFEWLSQSVSVASQSVPGDKPSLPPVPSVIEITL